MGTTMTDAAISAVLKQLHLGKENPGAYLGDPGAGRQGWSDSRGRAIASINPATGQAIAAVRGCSAKDYARLVEVSADTFRRWRLFPAPKRGEVIRRIADVLREHKDPLGSLVALETGKIKQEGDGEVQEMIDIADFAVGQSRMLYALSMHSERPDHRMYEQAGCRKRNDYEVRSICCFAKQSLEEHRKNQPGQNDNYGKLPAVLDGLRNDVNGDNHRYRQQYRRVQHAFRDRVLTARRVYCRAEQQCRDAQD